MALVKPISIEKEYEKNPDITPDDVRKLREWLKTQPHLPGEHISGKVEHSSIKSQIVVGDKHQLITIHSHKMEYTLIHLFMTASYVSALNINQTVRVVIPKAPHK